MEAKNLETLRHSAAHLLAAAVKQLWPSAQPTIGPAIENGFYYDFDFGNIKISEEDLSKIEKKMREILPSWKSFERIDVSPAEAKKEFHGNLYKLELIEELVKNKEKISIYQSGGFRDLCRGGHTDQPSVDLKNFKLLSLAGAYWRGDEKNSMLTRIYGTVFPTEEELKKHLAQLELAKERDHRKLGRELELFTVSEEVGPGLILWLPKGNIIKEELEKWAKETESAWGYQRVTTPHITKSGLYHTSGHLPYYQDDMYPPMKLKDGGEYYLKPMNCPHHHLIYASRSRSYRELPLRLAEYGTCYRYEAAGELFGLLRVRGFSQNDAHIYCTPEQAVAEFVAVMKLHEHYYRSLGITDYYLEMGLRDPKKTTKYHGDEKMWKLAEKMMREAVSKLDIKMIEKTGSAAFYGPKIDFIIRSSTGREFATSTNQIDLYMGDRFSLKYADKDGKEKTPVIIHRAPLGSHERFIGFLIEHFGGEFPVWLSPVQAIVIPISEKFTAYGRKVSEALKSKGIRSQLDDRDEKMQAKIRDAQLQKVPYMLVVGEREEKAKSAAVRLRSGKDLGAKTVTEITETIKQIATSRIIDLWR
ncbi:MAG: threonyl-tRNA synthetase, threonyl-tRNA synthetase [candidate division WWE3 bacterium CSP1-7]|uniref:Threonine--tRNA ligase n=1 Tax=candidate division WWE3 bacterium CSP1-7 TaxID=1576480 RepID=A0A0T5ZXJ0_UNCKA|nr:MAG: threonyl-tRNA synthetase, threonyl-tRNA synthetase [candidate division WWE3 bacterium CSP1-7]